jgi:hypothetical protein
MDNKLVLPSPPTRPSLKDVLSDLDDGDTTAADADCCPGCGVDNAQAHRWGCQIGGSQQASLTIDVKSSL